MFVLVTATTALVIAITVLVTVTIHVLVTAIIVTNNLRVMWSTCKWHCQPYQA